MVHSWWIWSIYRDLRWILLLGRLLLEEELYLETLPRVCMTLGDVGIGGHATIGGLGPASRQWGTSLEPHS